MLVACPGLESAQALEGPLIIGSRTFMSRLRRLSSLLRNAGRVKVPLESGIEVSPLRWLFKRSWDSLLPFVPLPVRLPFGGWWLAWDDLIDDLIFAHAYEQSEWRFMAGFVQRGMTVLDVGAHHGFYTILAAKRVADTGRVIAFEPSPRERRRLLWHLRLNRLGANVEVYPLAVTSGEGEQTLYIDLEKGNTGHNSLRAPALVTSAKKVPVRTASLDVFLREREIYRVDFVKMDVEGAELEVLKGARDLLAGNPRPVIMTEVQELTTALWGYPAGAIYDFLAERGYAWFSITGHGQLRACRKRKQYDTPCNMVAVPQERLGHSGLERGELNTEG